MVKRNEKIEFLGQLIDVFEDFLDEKGIMIPNPEKNEDPDNPANLYGTDYENIQSALEETLVNWGILESDVPEAEYLFKVSLNGVPCEGTLAVKAADEDTAYQIAQDMVSDRLGTAFPELDIEYGIDFVDADPDSSTPDPRGNVTWGYPCKSNYNKYPKYRVTSKSNHFDAEDTIVETASLDKAKTLFLEKMKTNVTVFLETAASKAAKWEVIQHYCRK